MGQGQSTTGSTFYAFGGGNNGPHHSSQPPLKFSPKHGDNCQILREGSQAKRGDSFCKGIVFSDRPVEVGERVCLRLTELSIRWSGVLRLGFTSNNPLEIQSLPKYACPDLTGKPGYWAKALAERYAESNALIHYYFTANGDVHFGVNGTDKGLFFSGLDTRRPLWCMMDLYGNCTAIEMVDMRRSLNNFATGGRGGNAEVENVVSEALEAAANSLNSLELEREATEDSNEVEVPLRFNSSATFRTLSFHPSTGPNLSLNGCSSIAWRHEDEYSAGYVFTAVPASIGERIVVQILATENMYIGSLAFGLTSCDPSSLDCDSLPEDSDMLLDRPEYWVVSKDVASCPPKGDELSFTIKTDGSVEFMKNNSIPSVFMHVDITQPLWAFWDIYGNTSRIRVLGSTTPNALMPRQVSRTSENLIEPASEASELNQSVEYQECIVCYEKAVDCVIYTCGHMCLCYECALQQWRGRGGGFCPICRLAIRDVIRTYKS